MSRTNPPALVIYDYAEGEYKPRYGGFCTARWATGNADHEAGEFCGRPATQEAGDVDLCTHHFERLRNWRYWEKPIEDAEEKTRALREADRAYAAAVRESEIHRERIRAQGSVVYYIRRMSDGMIKIGTTAEFRKRMATHRGEHGEIQILLTHSGTIKEEREAHKKFDVYRAGRGEWFHPARPLLNWILDTRSIERYKTTQGPNVVPQAEVRKLIAATPPDAYQWRRGKLVPVRARAEPAA